MRSGLALTGRNIGPRLIVWNLALAGRRRANPERRTSGGPSILPAMQPPEEARPRPAQQSAFVAAFLSLLFPGLGHAYVRAWTRAIGFAALPLLLLALLLGIFLKTGPIGSAVLVVANLSLILAGNVVAFIYRALAAIDAYRVVAFVNAQAEGSGRLGRRPMRLNPISVAGLAAVCLVIAGSHAVVAKYGGDAQAIVSCIQDANCDTSDSASPNPSNGPHPVAAAGRHTARLDLGGTHLERHGSPQHPAPGGRPAPGRRDL